MFDFSKAESKIIKNSEFVKWQLPKNQQQELSDFFEGLFSGFDQEDFESGCDFSGQAISTNHYSSGKVEYIDCIVNSMVKDTRNSFAITSDGKGGYSMFVIITKIIKVDGNDTMKITLNHMARFSQFNYQTGVEVGVKTAKHFNSFNEQFLLINKV